MSRRVTARFVACPMGDERQDLELVGRGRDRSSPASYRIVRCARHSIEFVDAAPSFDADVTAEALDILYGPASGQPAAGDAPPSRVTRFLDLVAAIAEPPGVLHDHGCGNGSIVLEAARRGWTVQGNDLVSRPAAALRGAGVTYYEAALASLDIDSSADVVTSYCVLPHVANPVSELGEIHRILRPGGWVVAEMPSNGLFRRVARVLHRASLGRWHWVLGQIYGPQGHRFGFDETSARESFERAGFRNIRVIRFRQEPRHSVLRFSGWPELMRGGAWLAVSGLDALSRLPSAANHLVAIGQK